MRKAPPTRQASTRKDADVEPTAYRIGSTYDYELIEDHLVLRITGNMFIDDMLGKILGREEDNKESQTEIEGE